MSLPWTLFVPRELLRGGMSVQPLKPDDKDTNLESQGLDRGLSNRQTRMLAIGGVIGVGLFYGASLSVKLAGPGVLLDFVLCGLIVVLVMRALGEMTVEEPKTGSFSVYAAKYLGNRIGFITAGMWWFFWVATVMSELAAIGKLLEYWFPSLPAWLPGLVALVLFTLSNLLVVRVFGELEYWFAILKVLAVSVFMIFGALIIFTGVFNHGDAVGFSNLWINHGFLPNGMLGVLMAISLVVQAYSGVETLAVEAGESSNPNVTMKTAFRSVTARILILYIGSMFITLCAFPWNYLINHSGSPYVLLFAKIGIPVAAGVVNLIIILSGLSSCNTGLYGGSRMLFSLAKDENFVPSIAKLNQNKVPYLAVWITGIAISIGILITYLAPNNVYVWITSASAFASLWTWAVILISEIVFRKRAKEQNQPLRYPMPWWPVTPIIGIILLIITFVAIATSPLTRISVLSGLAWLVILFLYHVISSRKGTQK